MPTYKFNFYRDGKLVHTCYTTRKANAYASELDSRGVDYAMKKIKLF